MKGSIYAIIDVDTYEVYIGSTIQGIKTRYDKHMTDLRMHLGLAKRGRNYRKSFEILIKDFYKVVCVHDFDNLSDLEDLKFFETLYMIKFKHQGLKVINTCIANKRARSVNWRNFGLKELDLSTKPLFDSKPLLI